MNIQNKVIMNSNRVSSTLIRQFLAHDNLEEAIKKCKESIKLLRDIISDFDE